MFNKPQDNYFMPPHYNNPGMQKIYYELEQQNRKLRNLNRRVSRIEKYLGLRTEDMDDENYLND